MKRQKKITICIVLMFISFHTFSQFVIVNITWINSDRSLLSVLIQKAAINSAIIAQQAIINTSLQTTLRTKIATRFKEFEHNEDDPNLRLALFLNLTINNLVMGLPIATPAHFPLYTTIAKNEYFFRELLLNNAIAIEIALVSNNNIRNANTRELYSLNKKMLTKLKKTNAYVHKKALFVIVASLISRAATMPASDLNQILSFGI